MVVRVIDSRVLQVILPCKLSALKEDLNKWNKDIFGDMGDRKTAFLNEIWNVDNKEERGECTSEEHFKRLELIWN